MRLLFLCVIILSCGCVSTFRTARITPPSHGSHNLGGELVNGDDIFLQYNYRRGVTKHLELGGGISANGGQILVGGKYGILNWWALDFDAKLLLFTGIDNDEGMLPGFDVASIFGNDWFYGGVKYLYPGWWEARDRVWPFIGFRIKVSKYFSLIPELSVGPLEPTAAIGLGINLETGK